MSVKAMNWAWDVRGLKPGPRVVLLKLADHANRFHQCWPSVPYLAEKSELTRRQVERILARLVKLGLLEREPWEGTSGKRTRRKHESVFLFTLAVREGMQETMPVDENDPMENRPSKNDDYDIRAEPIPTFATTDPDICDKLTPTFAPRARIEESTTESTTEPGAGTPPASPAEPTRKVWSAQAMVNTWNDVAPAYRLARVNVLSESRRRKAMQRLADRSFDWDAILAKIPEARAAHGQGWFDFNFLISNDTNYLKLLEGKYDAPFGSGTGQGQDTAAAGAVAAAQRYVGGGGE